MELRHLRYFSAVAEELHFGRAADRLHLSQPSLSQQIHQLEEQLNLQLFVRTKRNVKLTEAGQVFLKRTRRILTSVDEAVQEAQETAGGSAGTLRVSYITTALVGSLPQVLRQFVAAKPSSNVDLEELDPEEQIQHVLSGRTDIAFIHGTVNDPRLATLLVQSDHLILAAPSGVRLENPCNLNQLVSTSVIMPAPFSKFGYSDHVRYVFEQAGIRPCRTINTKLILAGIYMVASGIGVALVPISFRQFPVPGVSYYDLAIPSPLVKMHAVWRIDSNSRLLSLFLKLLSAHCSLPEPN